MLALPYLSLVIGVAASSPWGAPRERRAGVPSEPDSHREAPVVASMDGLLVTLFLLAVQFPSGSEREEGWSNGQGGWLLPSHLLTSVPLSRQLGAIITLT